MYRSLRLVTLMRSEDDEKRNAEIPPPGIYGHEFAHPSPA
jgi:hypothetical protein